LRDPASVRRPSLRCRHREAERVMRIDIFDCIGRVQRGELGIPMAVVLAIAPFAATGACVWLLSHQLPRFRALGLPVRVGIAILAALAGLVLTHVAYVCSSCQPYQAGCWVEVVGWPLPQVVYDIEPRPVQVYDVCRLSTGSSASATAVNFALPALGIPLVAALLRARRPQAR
jgi:drug/metabolite transporter (DMT)-like permease